MQEKAGKAESGHKVEDSNCPAWYAILPIIPLALVTIFSFVPDINLDVTSANLLSMAFAFLIELLRKRSKEVPDDLAFVMKAMGTSYASVVSILIGAAVFAEAIERIYQEISVSKLWV